MKALVFILLAFPYAVFGQCSAAYSGTLRAEVMGNTVILHNDTVRRICSTWYDMEIIQASGDTLIWNEIQQGGGAYCHCHYNLSVTVDSLAAGNYFVKTYASDAPFPGGDTCYIGSVTFTITEPNSFTSFIIANNYQSECFEVNVGINDQGFSDNEFLVVYPNPAYNFLTIRASTLAGDPHFTIFNIDGQRIIGKYLTDYETQINISALQTGVYFVKMQSTKSVEIVKFAKK